MKFEQRYREAHPETVGETDKQFDLSNYCDWLESLVEEFKPTNKQSGPFCGCDDIADINICTKCLSEAIVSAAQKSMRKDQEDGDFPQITAQKLYDAAKDAGLNIGDIDDLISVIRKQHQKG